MDNMPSAGKEVYVYYGASPVCSFPVQKVILQNCQP